MKATSCLGARRGTTAASVVARSLNSWFPNVRPSARPPASPCQHQYKRHTVRRLALLWTAVEDAPTPASCCFIRLCSSSGRKFHQPELLTVRGDLTVVRDDGDD